jgi:hypothetical protein
VARVTVTEPVESEKEREGVCDREEVCADTKAERARRRRRRRGAIDLEDETAESTYPPGSASDVRSRMGLYLHWHPDRSQNP